MHDEMNLLLTITLGLCAALVCGYAARCLKLPPILGYLLAGVVIGPHTPGPMADGRVAAELAEIGVVLLMFGVGLHFNIKDLLRVRGIAIPGALVQSLVATLLAAGVAYCFGWSFASGLLMGMAVSVASTVVLMRVLMDHKALNTPSGHAAVGWLVVEDIFTVLLLVLLPVLATAMHPVLAQAAVAASGAGGILRDVGVAVGKLALLVVLLLVVGARVVPWVLDQVARTRSRELFTLAVLAVALGIATMSAIFFGASIALGAFLAGIVVGHSQASQQAASDALPMRDAFAVLFFVSAGMLFDPRLVVHQPGLTFAILGIILIGKPLAALGIVSLLGYPPRTALTVAMGLAQIGEFSFILASQAIALGLLPSAGGNVLVAAALISIAINPLLFAQLPRLERWVQHHPRLFRALNWRFQRRHRLADPAAPLEGVDALVAGYGPVGRALTGILAGNGLRPCVIEMNIDTVKKLRAEGIAAIYGSAEQRDILEAAGIEGARFLLVTTPDPEAREGIVRLAGELNSRLHIICRARYLAEHATLQRLGVADTAYEELEVAITLAEILLREVGLSEERIVRETYRVRDQITSTLEG